MVGGLWWTLGPHNHSLGHLWRFRDSRLERAYEVHCGAWCVQIMLLHTVGMTIAYAVSTSYFLGEVFAMVRWLCLACSAVSLSLALLVFCSSTAKRHAVPIHAAHCCVVVAVHCALIHALYTAKTAEAAATWPNGLSPAEQQLLESYARRPIAYHSFLNALCYSGANWVLLAGSGLTAWSASAFSCTLVAFTASTVAAPYQSGGDSLRNVAYICATALAFFLISLLLERLRRSNFLAQTQLAQELQASQLADSILNHTLKNILVDVAANLEVFLSGAGDTELLADGIACLRRGMQHCRERQVYLKLAAGEYQPTPTPVHLPSLAHQLVAGRPVAVQVPDLEVLLDATLMALILENAISNAFRHGSPENPDVRFDVSEFIPDAGGMDSSEGQRQGHVQFIVSNAAHPQRPPLTPEDVYKLFHNNGMPQPESTDQVSFHIGLTHCALAAKSGGIELALRQEGDRVLFVASLATKEVATPVGRAASGQPVLPSSAGFPSGLCFCCIDDSPAAQRLLSHHIQRTFPAVRVHCFGSSAAEIDCFFVTALAEADVVILDQHLEFEDEMTYGTDLVHKLVAAGYGGLVCIRSANDSPDDRANYVASGAHCVLGKDVLGARMMEELAAAHARHSALSGAPTPLSLGGRPNPTVPTASSSTSSLPLSPNAPGSSTCPLLAGGNSELGHRTADFELHSVIQSPGSPCSDRQPGDNGVGPRRRSLPGEVPYRSVS
eukprot:EG_transcript_2551